MASHVLHYASTRQKKWMGVIGLIQSAGALGHPLTAALPIQSAGEHRQLPTWTALHPRSSPTTPAFLLRDLGARHLAFRPSEPPHTQVTQQRVHEPAKVGGRWLMNHGSVEGSETSSECVPTTYPPSPLHLSSACTHRYAPGVNVEKHGAARVFRQPVLPPATDYTHYAYRPPYLHPPRFSPPREHGSEHGALRCQKGGPV